MFLRVEYKKDGYNFYLTGECTNNIPVESLAMYRYMKSAAGLDSETVDTLYAIQHRRSFDLPRRQHTPSVVVCTATGKANLYRGAYGAILDKHLKPVVENWLKNANLSLEWVEEDEKNIVMPDYAYVGAE